jgi:YfiR/HmsC-like
MRLLLDHLARAGCVLLALLPAAAFAQYAEAEVKAAFVFNVAKFAEWPPEILPPGAPLRLCVLGTPDALGAALLALEGKTVQGRTLEVRAGAALAPLRPCHLLVLTPDVPEARRVLAGEQGTLTLGDGDGFTEAGGIIGITVAERRVRFDVNLEAARRGGIRLSAQLLRLARQVKGQ